MHPISLGTITALTICLGDLVAYGYANRYKRQLSPALQLEDNIQSLMRLHELGYKRSFGGDRLHLSPTMEFGDRLNELMSLQNVGKRPALSPADQFAQQFDMMEHLSAAGKKRSLSLSPATDFQRQLQLPQILADVGR